MTLTTYQWDPVTDQLLSEDDGTTRTDYTHEPNLYGDLLSQTNGTSTRFYHFDARGDTRQLTDESETVTDSWTYDAWGNVLSRTGIRPTPFQFLGKLGYAYDILIGLNYVRARWYRSQSGTWMSEDPIRFSDGLLFFEYCLNSPIVRIDPSGTCSCCCCPDEINLSPLGEPKWGQPNEGDGTAFPPPADYPRLFFPFTVYTKLFILHERIEAELGSTCSATWFECANHGGNLGQKPFKWFRIETSRPGMEQNWSDPPPNECPSRFNREWSDEPSVDARDDQGTAINFLYRVKPTAGCTCPIKELKFHFIVQMGKVKTDPGSGHLV